MVILFHKSFTCKRAYHTPDMLTPEANVVHRALRKTLLPQIGNVEFITSPQQWLLLHVMTSWAFWWGHPPYPLEKTQQDGLSDPIVVRRWPCEHHNPTFLSVGYFRITRINPQAHGYHCSFHLRVFQGYRIQGNVYALTSYSRSKDTPR
jgi:hypothetical protein